MTQLFYMTGNGQLSLSFANASLLCISGCESADRAFCSCIPELGGGEISIDSHRLPGSDILVHSIIDNQKSPALTVTRKRAPDQRITDLTVPDSPLFLRAIEAIDPINFRIIPARGAKFKLLQRYHVGGRSHSAALITLPCRSTGMDNISGQEHYLYIIPVGEASFCEDEQLIRAEPGYSAILFALGSNPSLIHYYLAKYAVPASRPLPIWESEIYRTVTSHWSARLAPIEKAIPDKQLYPFAEAAAVILLSHLGRRGEFLQNFEDLAMHPAVSRLLSKHWQGLGLVKEARSAADLIFEHWRSFDFAPKSGWPFAPPECTVNNCVPAYMAQAQLAYYSATGNTEFLIKRVPMLNSATKLMRDELVHNCLHFCGIEPVFNCGVLPPNAFGQASADATLAFIHTADTLLRFAKKHRLYGRKNYYATLRNSLAEVSASFARIFISDGQLEENNPYHLRTKHHSHFRYGICENCADHGVLRKANLERDANGRYLCMNCLGLKTEKTDAPTTRIPAFLSLGYFTIDSMKPLIPAELLRTSVVSYAKELLEKDAIEGIDLPKGMIYGTLLRLTAALLHSDSHDEEIAQLCRELYLPIAQNGISYAEHTGVFGMMYDYSQHAAALLDPRDPASAAYVILGLLDAARALRSKQ